MTNTLLSVEVMPAIITDYLRNFIILYSVKIGAFRSRCWGRAEYVCGARGPGELGEEAKLVHWELEVPNNGKMSSD